MEPHGPGEKKRCLALAATFSEEGGKSGGEGRQGQPGRGVGPSHDYQRSGRPSWPRSAEVAVATIAIRHENTVAVVQFTTFCYVVTDGASPKTGSTLLLKAWWNPVAVA